MRQCGESSSHMIIVSENDSLFLFLRYRHRNSRCAVAVPLSTCRIAFRICTTPFRVRLSILRRRYAKNLVIQSMFGGREERASDFTGWLLLDFPALQKLRLRLPCLFDVRIFPVIYVYKMHLYEKEGVSHPVEEFVNLTV